MWALSYEPSPGAWHPHKAKIETRRCLVCGEDRPVDWYVPGRMACWKCRALKRDSGLEIVVSDAPKSPRDGLERMKTADLMGIAEDEGCYLDYSARIPKKADIIAAIRANRRKKWGES